jgi:hypothetical protein
MTGRRRRTVFRCPRCDRTITPSRAAQSYLTSGPDVTLICEAEMPLFSLMCTCGHTTRNVTIDELTKNRITELEANRAQNPAQESDLRATTEPIVHQTGERTWEAVGYYDGHEVRVKARSRQSVLNLWRRRAPKRADWP